MQLFVYVGKILVVGLKPSNGTGTGTRNGIGIGIAIWQMHEMDFLFTFCLLGISHGEIQILQNLPLN